MKKRGAVIAMSIIGALIDIWSGSYLLKVFDIDHWANGPILATMVMIMLLCIMYFCYGILYDGKEDK